MTAARNQIIDTTCTLLELQGYHATGLNEILRESGTPKGSLYYYFPGGKEELVIEALSRAGDIVLQRIKEHLATTPDVTEAMRAFICNIAVHVESSGYQAGGPITTVAMEVAARQDRLRVECHRIYENWRQAFRDRLVEGGIDRDRSERLSSFILASIEGGILLCRTYRSPKPLRDMAAEIAVLLTAAR